MSKQSVKMLKKVEVSYTNINAKCDIKYKSLCAKD